MKGAGILGPDNSVQWQGRLSLTELVDVFESLAAADSGRGLQGRHAPAPRTEKMAALSPHPVAGAPGSDGDDGGRA